MELIHARKPRPPHFKLNKIKVLIETNGILINRFCQITHASRESMRL